jgi:diaminopimelate epimerase
MKIAFTKAEGSQNDFIVVDDRERMYSDEIREEFAIAVCHRRKGVGGDGVVFIDRSESHDFIMSFFNPDGSVGSMCGNGGRCAALFASARGISGNRMSFQALGKEYRAELTGKSVRLYFPEPRDIRINSSVTLNEKVYSCHYAHTGAPHAIIFANDLDVHSVADLKNIDVADLGSELRHATQFAPIGANANFVYLAEDATLHIRTFEKGVEAETESCGTGSIASAIVAALTLKLQPPIRLKTRNGDDLSVGFSPIAEMQDETDKKKLTGLFAKNLYFEGRASLVFDGELEFDPASMELHSLI